MPLLIRCPGLELFMPSAVFLQRYQQFYSPEKDLVVRLATVIRLGNTEFSPSLQTATLWDDVWG